MSFLMDYAIENTSFFRHLSYYITLSVLSETISGKLFDTGILMPSYMSLSPSIILLQYLHKIIHVH